MDEPKPTDHEITAVILALTMVVFILDLATPLGLAIWALYILPLGLTRWSSVRWLRFMLAGTCTVFIILGFVYSPPGGSVDVAVINRLLGVVMVWIAAFFLKYDRA